MKKLFLLIVTSLFVFSGFARDKSSLKFRLVYDGPYIDLENQSVPEGFEAIVVPRSSTFAKYGVLQTNSMGVIDNSYCGNSDWWHFPALAMRDTFIPKNARICQFRLLPNQMNIIMQKVNHLSNNDRGGLCSTGTN